MQRWISILFGLAALGLAVYVVVRTNGDRPSLARHEAAPDAASSASASGALDAGRAHDAGVKAGDAGLLDLAFLEQPLEGVQGAGARYPDGRPVPPLPEGTPKHVRLGVVLMSFAGAQGALPGTRAKADALGLATKLAADARTDFHGAVVRGDSGSNDDLGRMPRGILEPWLEYTLFTLPVGSVVGPLETPRGYWIVKRSE